MESLSLYPRSWRLRLFPDGTRAIDIELVPGSVIVECLPREGNQRNFIADASSRKGEKLLERMNDQKPAHACVFSLTGTIVEDKTAAVDSTPSEITKFEDAKPWGNVAPSRGDLLFRASPSSIDEIIRQESLNHPLYYIYAHFEGLERTTEANNEGGIVDYIWPIKTQDGSDRHLSVLSYSMSYHKSANYDPHAEPPYSLTNDDFSNVAWNIKYLFHEVESSRKYLGAIVLGLVILIVIIIWRH